MSRILARWSHARKTSSPIPQKAHTFFGRGPAAVQGRTRSYYPDSGIDDNNWWRILAVGKAGATKDARLVAPTCLAVAMDAKAETQRSTAEAPLPERTTPPTGKRTAKCVDYTAVRVVRQEDLAEVTEEEAPGANAAPLLPSTLRYLSFLLLIFHFSHFSIRHPPPTLASIRGPPPCPERDGSAGASPRQDTARRGRFLRFPRSFSPT